MLDVLADPAAPGTGVPVIARWTLQQLKDAIRAAILELDAAAAAERRSRRARRSGTCGSGRTWTAPRS